MDRGFSARGQGVAESAGVVVVAVAEHDSVGLVESDAKSAGVGREYVSLARVEEDSRIAQFNPERQPMLSQQTSPSGCVLNQRCNPNASGHCVFFC